jgi:CheY-like chemotaxis protein
MKSILVVDDCEEFRETVGDILSEAGYEVTLAGGADEARELVKERDFQVVICDLVLPVESSDLENESAMVGVHMVHEFSKLLPQVPIIAVSGALTGEPLNAIKQFGAVTTLSKPFGQKELLDAVGQALRSAAQLSC